MSGAHAWWGWPTHQRAFYAGMISRMTRQVHYTSGHELQPVVWGRVPG